MILRRLILAGIILATLVMSVFIFPHRPAQAASISWKDPVDGYWDDASKWSSGTVPGAGDSVSITVAGTYSVGMNFDVTVGSLALGGSSGTQTLNAGNLTVSGVCTVNANGVLTGFQLVLNGPSAINGTLTTASWLSGAGDLTVNGALNWNGGTIAGLGAFTVASSGQMNISSGNLYLNGRVISNSGTINFNNGLIYLSNASGITNEVTGTFNLRNQAGTFDSGGTGSRFFNNYGTITRALVSSSDGGYGIRVPFSNATSGIINIVSGTFFVGGGGTVNGAITIAAGGSIQFDSSTYTVTASISGPGNVLAANSATVNYSGTYTGTGSVAVSGGTLNFNSNATLNLLALSNSGTLGGSGNLVVNGMNWLSGAVTGSGSFTIAQSAQVNLTTGGGKGINGRTITNTGTVNWSGGMISFSNAAVFQNQSGSFFNMQGDLVMVNSGGTGTRSFNNAGNFTKTAGANAGTINIPFNNSSTGVVNILLGTLTFTDNSTSSGVYNAATGATLQFDGGTHTLDATSFISGVGNVSVVANFNPATVNFTGIYNATGTLFLPPSTYPSIFNFNSNNGIANLDISGGTLGGSGNLTVTAMNWTGGTITGSGTFATAGQASFGGGDKTLNGRNITNTGTTDWSSGNIITIGTVTYVNQAGASFNATGSNNFTYQGGSSSTRLFNNLGTVSKTAGAGTSNMWIPFNNNGILNVNTGTVSIGSGGASTGAFNIASGSIINFNGVIHALNPGASFSGAGAAQVSATVNVNTDLTVSNLNVSGTLGGTGNVGVSGTMNWTGGTISGSGQIGSSGVLNITSTNTKTLDGRTLTNSGTGNWSAGLINLYNAAEFRNLAGASFGVQGDLVMAAGSGSGPRSFTNEGILSKVSGALSAAMMLTVNNTGTINVNSGTLALNGGGTSTGTFNTGSGSTLQFGGGTYAVESGSSFTGAGTVGVSGGTVNFNGMSTGIGNLDLSGGTLGGSGGVTVNTNMNWTGGTITGPGQFTSMGLLNLSGANIKTLDGRAFSNGGVASWMAGVINFYNSASFRNMVGATFGIQGDLNMTNGGGAGQRTFINDGALSKVSGAMTSTMNILVNTAGTVNVLSGTLALNGGGTSTGAFSTGSGTTLQFGGGAYAVESGSSFTGAGTVGVSGGTVNFNGMSTGIGNLDLSGGTLGGSGGVTVNTNMNWTGGTITGPGQFTTMGLLNLSGANTKTLDGRAFSNGGVASWMAGVINFYNSASFRNMVGATFGVQGDLTMADGGGSGQRNFTNDGTLSKGSGNLTAAINVPLTNGGTLNAGSGTLSLSGGLSNISADTLSGGIFVVNAGLKILNARIVTNAANMTVGGISSALMDTTGRNLLQDLTANRGVLSFENGAAFSAGAPFSNTGTLSVGTGSTFSTAGGLTNSGTVTGVGSITANISNSGTVSPGSSPGTLNITGDYIQAADGILNLEIGGLTAGTQYDRINITGNATLNGTLNITLVNGFTPSSGNSFQVMTFGSRTGDFTTKTGLAVPGNLVLAPVYNPANLTLTAGSSDKTMEGELVQSVDANGYVVFQVNVKRVKLAASGADIPVSGGIGSFSASVTYNAAGLTIAGTRGNAPFSTIDAYPNIESGTKTTVSSSQSGSAPQAPITVAYLLPSLIGTKDNTYDATLSFTSLSSSSGEVITPGPAAVLPNLKRGNARDTDAVTITDALFIAQYLAGLRPLGTGDTATNALNAASVKRETGAGEKITIADALLIAQMLAGLRDASFN